MSSTYGIVSRPCEPAAPLPARPRPPRIPDMFGPGPPAPAPAAVLALALPPTACDGGVHGTPGGSGVRDPYSPKAGNGGYDATHYGLTLSYDPARHPLTGTAVITAHATKDLSAF